MFRPLNWRHGLTRSKPGYAGSKVNKFSPVCKRTGLFFFPQPQSTSTSTSTPHYSIKSLIHTVVIELASIRVSIDDWWRAALG
jgi:hypothetical protein